MMETIMRAAGSRPAKRAQEEPDGFDWVGDFVAEQVARVPSLAAQQEMFADLLADPRVAYADMSPPWPRRLARRQEFLRAVMPHTLPSLTRRALGTPRLDLPGFGRLTLPAAEARAPGPDEWAAALRGGPVSVGGLVQEGLDLYRELRWPEASARLRQAQTLARLTTSWREDVGPEQEAIGLHLRCAADLGLPDEAVVADLAGVITKATSRTFVAAGGEVLCRLMHGLAAFLAAEPSLGQALSLRRAVKVVKIYGTLMRGEAAIGDGPLYDRDGSDLRAVEGGVAALWRRHRVGMPASWRPPEPVARGHAGAQSRCWRYVPGRPLGHDETAEGRIDELRARLSGRLDADLETFSRRLFDDRVLFPNLPRGRNILLVGDQARGVLADMLGALALPHYVPHHRHFLSPQAGVSMRNIQAIFAAAAATAQQLRTPVVVALFDCHESIRERAAGGPSALYKMETAAFLQAFTPASGAGPQVLVWCSTPADAEGMVDAAWRSRCGTTLTLGGPAAESCTGG